MKIAKDKLIEFLKNYFEITRKIDFHNDFTYNHSVGYYKGQEDLIKIIENYKEEE